MDKTQALQNLLDGTASEEEINLLKHGLASGEISIGGNVNQSVVIIGSGNRVELTPEALDLLNARPLLGDLDRDLTGKEIALGLERLESELSQRAPVLTTQFQEQARRLRPSLKTNAKSLGDHTRKERVEALAVMNSLCMEALDISFNALCLGEESPEYDARSPFRGLESFRPEDSEFFFGREALTGKLVGKIQAHSFLAILGASGSGKSSLVMAGLIPALGLDYIIFRPGTNPLGALESAQEKALIVVDQFEELFTLMRDEATRKEFIAKLLDASKRSRIILTLRSDFLGEVATYRALNEEVQSRLEIVPPMDMDELRRAMEGQAGVVGLRFEADLSQQILDDVEGEPGAMPLLQHALWELWNRRHGHWLRSSEYRAFGGVKQAITSTAEKVYADCSKPEQDSLRDIFLRLTRLDDSDEGRDTRRRDPLGDLIPSGRDAASITVLLDKLANARLIVKTVNEDKTEVEVAHEALIRHWERLRIWLNEDRDALRLRESVSESAKEWEKSSRHESLLNSRWVKLNEALLLAQDSRYRLTEIEQAYLKGCMGLRNKEQRERERRKITLTSVFAVAVTIMLLLVGWSISSIKSANAKATQISINSTQVSVANTAQINAENAKATVIGESNIRATAQVETEYQRNIAISRQLAAQAQSILDGNEPNRRIATLLGIQSLKMFPSSDAVKILYDTLDLPSFSIINNARVNSVAFSLDGRYVASGSENGHVMVFDAYTGDEVYDLNHYFSVNKITFSPNGKYIISSGWDSVRVWDISSGEEIAIMNHELVYTHAVSLDGKYIASGGYDDTIRVWQTSRWIEISQMKHDDYVTSISFSPDGKYIRRYRK